MSIHIKNLTHVYNKGLAYESVALDDVSIDIEDGELVCIIGHTGSGKSTLIQHMNGLLKPDSGNIWIGDVDITQKKVPMVDIRKKIGIVFQYPEYQLFEETVRLDVEFGPKNLGLTDEEVKQAVDRAFSLVGMQDEEVQKRSPFELSGGQKRKAAIAGVLAMKPEVLILDEPAAGLDPKSHRELIELLLQIHEKEKDIMIIVSHNMQDVADIADKVIVMDRGKCVMCAPAREIFARREELKAIGLSTPPITEILHKIKEKLPKEQAESFNSDVISVSEAAQHIRNFVGGKID
ncbi:MAG: energy-coupling factor transporter ATPase [Eubacteriales bacterium]